MEQPHAPPREQHLVHIRELDGLRGVAALMVLFHHVCYNSYPNGGTRLITFFSRAFTYGRTGVDLFFVLSGFLITSLLIKARSSPRYYQDFYWKRALRVLPLYLACLIGVALFQPGALKGAVLAALFLANFAPALHAAFSNPFWTLAIEEQFYIAWPTVVRRRSILELQHWAYTIGLTCVGLRFAAAWFGHFNYAITFLRCDGLAFGALLSCWFMQGGERLGGRVRERVLLAVSFWLGLLCLLLALQLPAETLRAEAYQAAVLQTGVTLTAGSVVGYMIRYRNTSLLAVFRGRVLTFFGLISYALYLLHFYVLMIWDHAAGAPDPGSNASFISRTAGITALSVLFAVLSRYVIELPSLSLRRYVLRAKS